MSAVGKTESKTKMMHCNIKSTGYHDVLLGRVLPTLTFVVLGNLEAKS